MTPTRAPRSPAEVAARYPYGYAVVDVETSGLDVEHDRVLQIALCQLRADGSVEARWSTLLDPGCDPGPVQIHGLTRQRLAGSPCFADVAALLAGLLRGRIVVAHNAEFDWQFLTAEADRVHRSLSVRARLCTMTLLRGLPLPLTALSLAAVARYWGVAQFAAHDAEDDTRVLVEVLRQALALSSRLDLDLPLVGIDAEPVAGPPSAGLPEQEHDHAGDGQDENGEQRQWGPRARHHGQTSPVAVSCLSSAGQRRPHVQLHRQRAG